MKFCIKPTTQYNGLKEMIFFQNVLRLRIFSLPYMRSILILYLQRYKTLVYLHSALWYEMAAVVAKSCRFVCGTVE